MTRMSKLLIALACAGAVTGSLRAADDYPVLVYPCYHAGAPPTIDGRLDDACWTEAPLVGGFCFYDKPDMADVQTFFRAVADDQALYLAVHCDEPFAGQLVKGRSAQRDDHPSVFGGEAIELFVDPRHDHMNYYQIAFSLSESLFDGRGTDTSWNSNTKVCTAIVEQGWDAEVAVPLADLGLAQVKPGLVLGLNLCRDRQVRDSRQWTTWSRLDANFHDPKHFGQIVLFPTATMIGALSQELRAGDRQGPLQVYAAEGFSGATYLALAKEALRQVDAAIAELEQLRQQESGPVAEAIRKRVETAAATVAPFRQKTGGAVPLDAAEWLRTDAVTTRLRTELRSFIWQARLDALLSGI